MNLGSSLRRHCPLLSVIAGYGIISSGIVPLSAICEDSATTAAHRSFEPGYIPTFQTRYDGLWGSIECRSLTLEPSDEFISTLDEASHWRERISWGFYRALPEVRRLLLASGIDRSEVEILTQPAQISYSFDGRLDIFPSDELVWNLSPETRARLYPTIGLNTADNLYANPFALWNGGIRRMISVYSGLTETQIRQIEHLSYTDAGNNIYFTDVRWVLQKAKNEIERNRILRTLLREISMHAWLDLSSTDPSIRESIISYWSSSGRNERAAGLLNASLNNPAIDSVEVGRLLPPKCKRLLNTYPNLEESVGSHWPDCFATSFSFFSNEFQTRSLQDFQVIANERYERAKPPWQFGDVVVIVGSNSNWLHACNHIAGDIVFTKNGKSAGRPWVLQQLDEVLASYLKDERVQAFYLRLKPNYQE